MKIYLIHNDYENNNDGGYIHEITPCATRNIAEQLIKPMIADELQTQLDNGTIVERNGTIEFDCHDSNCTIIITDTELRLRDFWGFSDEIWIEEAEVITEIKA